MTQHTLLTHAALASPLALLASAPHAPGVPSAEDAPGRIQLFPAGCFAARDGRPASIKGSQCRAWRLTAEDAAALMALWQTRATPLVIDYEHQTHLTEKNGQPAPAAGWVTALDWQDEGLFAAVDWTARARARAHIAAKEYLFISPTFRFDPVNGAVLELVSVALTNNPALDGMDAVQAKHQGEPHMDKLFAMLRKLLGLPETATEEQCAAALTTLTAQIGTEGITLSALLTSKEAEIAALKSLSPNPSQYAPVALLTATQGQLAAVQAELAALKNSTATAELTADIEAALADGRLHAAGKDWALELARSNPQALRQYLNITPPIAALKSQQTADKTPPDTGTASLTAEDEYVCAQLGIAHADYLKTKETK